ncbi:hypothetical protein RclHR1_13800007 [Rhizophagus clarus]|uniref:Uncharacterized protein n=1 Tax=Rhizophagus clarus TaxID=94130 RepID=A0A2Z6QB16_9GLOM|nr:hypothetical protein RclHR1_13800007 [Rhizophagus clarus]
MVQKREPRQEQTIYSPYYYPNSSRYNYPAKIGGDEDQYTEPKFSFPHWDDEVQPYTPLLRRRASTPFINADYSDYFNKSLSLMDNEDDNDDGSESEAICDKIQNDIDLARKDQKTDYDQFRKAYATFHDDIRALQREIEAIEAICMKNGFDLKRGGTTGTTGTTGATGTTITADGTEIYYDPTCTVPDSNNDDDDISEGNRLLACMPSATAAAAAARGMIAKKRSSPSILYRKKQQQQQNMSGTFNDNNNNNNNNRRCLGIEDGWIQERVHQNEGIRC